MFEDVRDSLRSIENVMRLRKQRTLEPMGLEGHTDIVLTTKNIVRRD